MMKSLNALFFLLDWQLSTYVYGVQIIASYN